MKQFILSSLEQMTTFGYVVLVVVITYVGWSWGGANGSAVVGLVGGFVLGLVAATVIFGLVLLGFGILRNTSELVLVSRLGPERAQEALRVRRAATSFMGLSANQILAFSTNLYLWLFFGYMFLPLIFMIMAAFNTPSIPQAIPMEGFTLHWFGALFGNRPLWSAVANSVAIGVGVIVMSLTLGLAGALLLTRLRTRARTFIYAVLVSPLLTPGIILGISTLIFWSNLGIGGGMFLATVAQSTFISAYCMLLFMARLQRFDPALEEAALDLGASHQQVFWKITLPFLRPTILTGSVLAFLQSFENFNTTVFAIGPDTTMTIQIASMVRLGLSPEVNALAVLFIVLTIVIAIAYELKRRSEKARQAIQAELAKRLDRAIATEAFGNQPATASA
jgi:spermidine/putrescine transport system permease protein